MVRITLQALFGKFNELGYRSLESATAYCKVRTNPYVELEHWLQSLLQKQDSDLHAILRHFAIDQRQLAIDLTEALDRLPDGSASRTGLGRNIEQAAERAWFFASLGLGASNVRTGVLMVAILETPNLRTALFAISNQFRRIRTDDLGDSFATIVKSSPEESMRAFDGTTIATPTEGGIFVCYRHEDSTWQSKAIADRLKEAFGTRRVFKDVDSIGLGARFKEDIQKQIRISRVVLVVIGSRWLDSVNGRRNRDDFVQFEIAEALANDVRVLPLLVDATPMPSAAALPEQIRELAARNAFEVREDPHFDGDMNTLIERLKLAIEPDLD